MGTCVTGLKSESSISSMPRASTGCMPSSSMALLIPEWLRTKNTRYAVTRGLLQYSLRIVYVNVGRLGGSGVFPVQRPVYIAEQTGHFRI